VFSSWQTCFSGRRSNIIAAHPFPLLLKERVPIYFLPRMALATRATNTNAINKVTL
jgi:hypothetical protein